jgi:hypothetical protein
MKQMSNTVIDVRKPVQPHRVLKKEEIPTEAEKQKRYARIEKLKKLGINNTTLDFDSVDNDGYEEDMDKLKASILIMQDKEVPRELEEKIIRSNATVGSDRS